MSFDEQSTSLGSCTSSFKALPLDCLSCSSNSTFARGILKKKTLEESLSSDVLFRTSSNSSGSFGGGSIVTFDSVEICEHPITLGVNPAVADGGPPIEIEWEQQSYEMTTVDDFEQTRRERSTSKAIRKLGPQERVQLLLKSGFSESDLTRAEDNACSARLMREMTKRRCERVTAASISRNDNLDTKQTRRDKKSRAPLSLIKAFRLKTIRRSYSDDGTGQ